MQDFWDITEIYASEICFVEYSYGYNSTEVMLCDKHKRMINK